MSQIADITVSNFGINTEHQAGLVIRRPSGLNGEWLVMCFNTPFWVEVRQQRLQGMPGDCVIHGPEEPHAHGALMDDTVGFRNDWVHLAGAGVNRLVDTFALTCNSLLPTGEPQLIRSHLHGIRREMYSCQAHKEQATGLLVAQMFLDIARSSDLRRASIVSLIGRQREIQAILTDARIRIHESIDRQWSVKEMAELADMSTHQFAVTYKQMFAVSPLEDLLRQRLDVAKWLLAASNASVTCISEKCGFGSVYYFSRIFRQRVGVSPSRYARTVSCSNTEMELSLTDSTLGNII